MAVSQANATLDMNISGALIQNATKSFNLSKRYAQIMVNVSMLNILYRRSGGINPAELKCKEFKGVEFVSLKTKDPEDAVMKYLLYVLQGIKSAIIKGYLKDIFLLFKHPETSEPLEVYSITLKYNTGRIKKDESNFADLRDKTLDVLRVISNLDQIKKLPKLTKVKVELTYNDNTPVEYQPPGFKEVEAPMCMGLEKDRLVYGVCNTGYHKLLYTARGQALMDNMANLAKAVEAHNTSLEKHIELNEREDQDSEVMECTVQSNALDSQEHGITDIVDLSAVTELDEEREVIDENKNVIASSSRTLNAALSISLISSEDSVPTMDIANQSSIDPVSCICEVNSEMFAKSDLDEREIEIIGCDRCKKTYHMPCHGYLSPLCYREFICVKCSPYNTTDTIIRSIEGHNLRIVARCRLLIYLMKKYQKTQDKLISLFPDNEKDNITERFIKFNIIRKKKIDILQIERSANVIFNIDDSQFLF